MKIRHGQGPRLSFNFLRRPCRLLKREFSHAPQPLVEPMKTMVFRSLSEWKMKHFESLQVSCEKIAKNCKNHLKFVFWPLKCPRRVQQAISDVIWPITRPCTLTESYSRICQNHHFLSSKMAWKGSIREVCRPSRVNGIHDVCDPRNQAVKLADVFGIEKVWASIYEANREHGDFTSKASKQIFRYKRIF